MGYVEVLSKGQFKNKVEEVALVSEPLELRGVNSGNEVLTTGNKHFFEYEGTLYIEDGE